MTDINTVTIVGRLTRDSELTNTQSGYSVCKFSIASNRSRKQGDSWVDDAGFFDITLWGKRGEALAGYLTKGKQVVVSGELRQDRWEKDGAKRSKVYIEAKDIQLIGGKKDEASPHVVVGIPPAADPAARKPGDAPGNKAGFEDDVPW